MVAIEASPNMVVIQVNIQKITILKNSRKRSLPLTSGLREAGRELLVSLPCLGILLKPMSCILEGSDHPGEYKKYSNVQKF